MVLPGRNFSFAANFGIAGSDTTRMNSRILLTVAFARFVIASAKSLTASCGCSIAHWQSGFDRILKKLWGSTSPAASFLHFRCSAIGTSLRPFLQNAVRHDWQIEPEKPYIKGPFCLYYIPKQNYLSRQGRSRL